MELTDQSCMSFHFHDVQTTLAAADQSKNAASMYRPMSNCPMHHTVKSLNTPLQEIYYTGFIPYWF